MGRKPLELTKEGKWLFCPPPSIQCISLAEIIRHEGRALHKFNYKVSVSYPPAIEQVVRRKGRNWRCWIHINLWGKLLKGLVAFLCKMQRLCSYKSGENLTNTNRNNKVKKLLNLPSFEYPICFLILSKQIGWMKRRKSPKNDRLILFFRRKDPDDPPDSCRIHGSLSLNKVHSCKISRVLNHKSGVWYFVWYRVTHHVSGYILLPFILGFQHVAYKPCQFCQICSSQSRIRQTSELPDRSQQNVVFDLTGHPVQQIPRL